LDIEVTFFSLLRIFTISFLVKILQVGGSSGFIFFYEEDKNFSVGLFNLLNNPYRKIELPSAWRTENKTIKC
jgi:hypothetical protein